MLLGAATAVLMALASTRYYRYGVCRPYSATERSHVGVEQERTDHPQTPYQRTLVPAEVQALWPTRSELREVQLQADAGKRPEMLDPKKVAELYLKDRLGSWTVAGEKGEFGLGEARVWSQSGQYADVGFAGAHDLPLGGVEVARYNIPKEAPNRIWFVFQAGNPIVAPFNDYASYEDCEYKEWISFQGQGTAQIVVKNQTTGEILRRETRQILGKRGDPLIFDRMITARAPIHWRIRYKTDGKSAFHEFISTSHPYDPAA